MAKYTKGLNFAYANDMPTSSTTLQLKNSLHSFVFFIFSL